MGLYFTPDVRAARVFYDRLYGGEIARFERSPAASGLAAFAAGLCATAFHPVAPVEIHEHFSGEELDCRIRELQKQFQSSVDVARLWGAMFEEAGLELDDTVRDRPILRFQTPEHFQRPCEASFRTAPIGFHRDTWGSNIYCQVNWWLPVFDLTPERTFAILTDAWDVPVPNNSAHFDLRDVMRRFRENPSGIHPSDLLPRPRSPVDLSNAVRVQLSPGDAIAFSGQHAHAGIPNSTSQTRISLDMRTASLSDFSDGRGAPNVDGSSAWIALNLFRSGSGGRSMAELLGKRPFEPYEVSR